MILLLMILFAAAYPAGLWFSLVLNQKEHTQQLAISLPSLHMFIHKKPLPDWSLRSILRPMSYKHLQAISAMSCGFT